MSSPEPRDEIVTYLPHLRAFARSLTGNPATADDMVQDTVVKAWTNIDKFKPGTNMRAWLFTILRNTFYSAHRRRRREVSDPDGIFAGSLSQKPDHDGHLNLADFRKAFAQLRDDQREVLILLGAEGFSYEEAAEMCGVPIGTVKSRANRARARLAVLMQLDGESPLELTDAHTMAVISGNRAA